MAAAALGGSQAEPAHADRRITRPEMQQQAGLVGEFGVGRHHHIGVPVGLRQSLRHHQGAEIGGAAHLQIALLLSLQQLPFAAAGAASGLGAERCGRHWPRTR